MITTNNAESQRRRGFIDNSLDTKLLPQELKNYFSNDDIKCGIYKLAVNCMENCFFTFNIAQAMKPHIIAKNAILLLIFCICAYVGFANHVLPLTILQLLVIPVFVIQLVKHLKFTSKLQALFDNFILFFRARGNPDQEDTAIAISLVLEYETALAFYKIPVSTCLYEQMNCKLSKAWEELKERYEIRSTIADN